MLTAAMMARSAEVKAFSSTQGTTLVGHLFEEAAVMIPLWSLTKIVIFGSWLLTVQNIDL